MNYLIKDASIVNEGQIYEADLLIKNGRIEKIAPGINLSYAINEINARGLHLLPGAIDDQVHFREPGLTHKATIGSESSAAVAGGVTSFMDMPNTQPATFTQALLEDKYKIGAASAVANYSFYMGTSHDNYDELMRTNEKRKTICGIKIFMGSSTGNLLVDDPLILEKIFGNAELLIATHCEDEKIIQQNYASLKSSKMNLMPDDHALIRNDEGCYACSVKAIEYARKYGSRLHILHITTAKELSLFTNQIPLKEKKITTEVCVHHLHFTAADYAALGYKIKCNPSIKSGDNKEALWQALLDNRLDVIATDHAPHLLSEKEGSYEHTHAGLPLIQHPLLLMLYYVQEGRISVEKVVEKMSHAVAECFQITDRGFIREGYFADLVLVNLQEPFVVDSKGLLYKCGWSPLEGIQLPATIHSTFVNGHRVYHNGKVDDSVKGQRLTFNR